MLEIVVPENEFFVETDNSFHHIKTTTLQLEHSLVSLSKWESKWNKPFLGKDEKTVEECIDYVKCMTITQHVDPYVYYGITTDTFEKINKYIELPMTATWFGKKEKKSFGHEVVTAEVIYYWMISLNIPFECQKWHLNKLITLIRVCNEKNAPHDKATKQELGSRYRALNAARRKSHR